MLTSGPKPAQTREACSMANRGSSFSAFPARRMWWWVSTVKVMVSPPIWYVQVAFVTVHLT